MYVALCVLYVGLLVCILVNVLCFAEAATESSCWLRVPDQDKSICYNVERSPDYSGDETMPYFIGDVLHHILASSDGFLQIGEERRSLVSYLSKCADRFSDNLSLKRNQLLPAFYWPNLKMSSRILPRANYYYAHIPVMSQILLDVHVHCDIACIHCLMLRFSHYVGCPLDAKTF